MAEAKVLPDPFTWEIEPPRSSPGIDAGRFDQYTQDVEGFGPEPEQPSTPAPETDGRDMPGAAP